MHLGSFLESELRQKGMCMLKVVSSETNLGVKGLITGFSSSHAYPYTCEVSTAISTAECSEEKYEREVKTYQSIHMQETCPAM